MTNTAHRHEVAEQCGIADSELPATLPVSADRQLGRALYFIRELIDIASETERDRADAQLIARARKFLTEADAS